MVCQSAAECYGAGAAAGVSRPAVSLGQCGVLGNIPAVHYSDGIPVILTCYAVIPTPHTVIPAQAGIRPYGANSTSQSCSTPSYCPVVMLAMSYSGSGTLI